MPLMLLSTSSQVLQTTSLYVWTVSTVRAETDFSTQDRFSTRLSTSVASRLASLSMSFNTIGSTTRSLGEGREVERSDPSEEGLGLVAESGSLGTVVAGCVSFGLGLSFLNVCCHMREFATSLLVRYFDMGVEA